MGRSSISVAGALCSPRPLGSARKTDRLDARVDWRFLIEARPSSPKRQDRPQRRPRSDPKRCRNWPRAPRGRRAKATKETCGCPNPDAAPRQTRLSSKLELGRRLKTLDPATSNASTPRSNAASAPIPRLKRRYDIVRHPSPASAPSPAVPISSSACTELGACSAKAAALPRRPCAHMACDSGDKAGERHIKGGRAFVRTGLYLAGHRRRQVQPRNSEATTDRLTQSAGKKAKVAIRPRSWESSSSSPNIPHTEGGRPLESQFQLLDSKHRCFIR